MVIGHGFCAVEEPQTLVFTFFMKNLRQNEHAIVQDF